MPRLPGINHLQAVRALQKAGFVIVRQSKHIIMNRGARMVVIPRNNPIQPLTMGSIIRAAGLTIDEFKKLLIAISILPFDGVTFFSLKAA